MKVAIVELENVSKGYVLGTKLQPILSAVSLRIQQGESVAIMGASGSGKSTLMNIIGLLDRPCSGSYSLMGKNIASLNDDALAQLRNQTIGFVFQQFYLLSRLTARQNVALPLTYRNMKPQLIEARVTQMLQKVGMLGKAHHKPQELSGGQQQRVAIARALVGGPKLILADEPTGALDSKTSKDILNLFLQLNEEEGSTLVMVTHDVEVAKCAQRTIYVRDGRLYSTGSS